MEMLIMGQGTGEKNNGDVHIFWVTIYREMTCLSWVRNL